MVMATERRKKTECHPEASRVNRAAADLVDAVERLVASLDDDPADVKTAAFLLTEIDLLTIERLSEALAISTSPQHGVFLVGVLVRIGARERARVIRALSAALQREHHPYVEGAIHRALGRLIVGSPDGPFVHGWD
jgi:hypothetical protein